MAFPIFIPRPIVLKQPDPPLARAQRTTRLGEAPPASLFPAPVYSSVEKLLTTLWSTILAPGMAGATFGLLSGCSTAAAVALSAILSILSWVVTARLADAAALMAYATFVRGYNQPNAGFVKFLVRVAVVSCPLVLCSVGTAIMSLLPFDAWIRWALLAVWLIAAWFYGTLKRSTMLMHPAFGDLENRAK